jgi:hypothetical protein
MLTAVPQPTGLDLLRQIIYSWLNYLSSFIRRDYIMDGKTKRFKGVAGELFVQYQLVDNDYNPGFLIIDSGIDIIAEKQGKIYKIQVKTVSYFSKKVGHFLISISNKKMKQCVEDKINLVIVLLKFGSYITLPPNILETIVGKKKDYLKIIPEFENDKIKRVCLQKKDVDITTFLNNFDKME